MERLNRRIENYWDERSKDFSRSRRLELDGLDGAAWRNILKKKFAHRQVVLDVGTGAGFSSWRFCNKIVAKL